MDTASTFARPSSPQPAGIRLHPAWNDELLESHAAIERQLAELRSWPAPAPELVLIRQALSLGAQVLRSMSA